MYYLAKGTRGYVIHQRLEDAELLTFTPDIYRATCFDHQADAEHVAAQLNTLGAVVTVVQFDREVDAIRLAGLS